MVKTIPHNLSLSKKNEPSTLFLSVRSCPPNINTEINIIKNLKICIVSKTQSITLVKTNFLKRFISTKNLMLIKSFRSEIKNIKINI